MHTLGAKAETAFPSPSLRASADRGSSAPWCCVSRVRSASCSGACASSRRTRCSSLRRWRACASCGFWRYSTACAMREFARFVAAAREQLRIVARVLRWRRSPARRLEGHRAPAEAHDARIHGRAGTDDDDRGRCGAHDDPARVGVPRFEYALSAATLLALVAVQAGDQVGLLLFDNELRAFVPPARGEKAMRSIRQALIPAHATLTEPDYASAFRTLATRHCKRSLIVLIHRCHRPALIAGGDRAHGTERDAAPARGRGAPKR